MPKLVVNDREERPKKKVKLHREIGTRRAKLILEDPRELEKLKDELPKGLRD